MNLAKPPIRIGCKASQRKEMTALGTRCRTSLSLTLSLLLFTYSCFYFFSFFYFRKRKEKTRTLADDTPSFNILSN
jgi:hypothetical protein